MADENSSDPTAYAVGNFDGYAPAADAQPYGQSLGDIFTAQLAAVGGGYLSRRLDIDLAKRWATSGTVGLSGDQRAMTNNPQAGLIVARNGTVGINLGQLLPLLLIGALVYVAAR